MGTVLDGLIHLPLEEQSRRLHRGSDWAFEASVAALPDETAWRAWLDLAGQLWAVAHAADLRLGHNRQKRRRRRR